MNPLKAFFGTLCSEEDSTTTTRSIYDVEINALNGKPIDLKAFKNKYMLFVNVASKCGFTPQYKDLQKLQDTYIDKLVVIGVPCNQFGKQEPENSETIQQFCEVNYGVTFPITEKINVKGKEQHSLYNWLTKKENNGVKTTSVKWNFQKYLVGKNGELLDYFYSLTKPLDSKITALLT